MKNKIPNRKQTELSAHLRTFQSAAPQVSRETIAAAADEIERYYNGMLNWKATAEAKDVTINQLRSASRYVASAQTPTLRSDPESEMLDMLGRIHPFALRSEDDTKDKRYERLSRAYCRQQPWPVPDQACIVWRADLMHMSNDLTHKQAYFDMHRGISDQVAAPTGWTQDVPYEQDWYWHWTGDPDQAPFPVSVMYSGTANKCFVAMTSTHSGKAEWCEEYGGYWLKIQQPSTQMLVAL